MLRELFLKKENLRKSMEALWSKRAESDWTKDDKTSYDKYASELDSVNSDIKLRAEFVENFKAQADTEDKKFAQAKSKASLFNIIRSKLYEQTRDNAYKDDYGQVNEVLQETRSKAKHIKDGYFPVPETAFEKRTDITSGTQGGDSLISEVVRPDLYVEGLYESTWMSQAGVPTINGLSGDLKIPQINDKPSFSWIAENTNFPEQDTSFDDVTLSPKYAGAIQVFSLGIFLRAAGASITRFVQDELMRSFRSGLEKSFIQDDGTSNKPKGLYSIAPAANNVNAATGMTTNKGGSVTYAEALSVEQKITSTNQTKPLKWLLNDGIRIKALQVLKFAVNGASQLYMNNMFADRPAIITNSIQNNIAKGTGTTSKAILFQPKSLVLGRWIGGIQLQVNTQGAEYWKAGKTAVRVIDVCNLVSRRDSDFASYAQLDA